MYRKKKRFLFRILAAVLLLLLCGCRSRTQSRTIFAMDTVMDLQVWGDCGEDALNCAQAILQKLDSTYDVTDPDSLIGRLNQGQSVELTQAEASFLQEAAALCRETGGALDLTVYPIVSLWGFTTGSFQVPDDAALRATLSHVGMDGLHLQDQSACLNPGTELDLGAVAKGYAGRLLAGEMERLGVSCALFSLGGNIQTVGSKPDGSAWRVSIQDPADPSRAAAVLRLEGSWAVVTSGGYQRYFEQNGIRYHHIFDPSTGCPAASGLTSVTVVCKDGLRADGLSTALFVMGLDRAADFWRQAGDFEAVFLAEDGMYVTAGLAGCTEGGDFTVIEK